jgi:hypothetical protein
VLYNREDITKSVVEGTLCVADISEDLRSSADLMAREPRNSGVKREAFVSLLDIHPNISLRDLSISED